MAPVHLAAHESLVMSWWMSAGEVEGGLAAALGGPPGFPAKGHAPYPGGMAYIFGYNVTVGLAEVASRVGLVDAAPEDMIVGLWVGALGHSGSRVARVHTPCFHNVATRVYKPESVLRVASRHWLAAPCTPQSLLMHYMTPELWNAVDAEGNLHCGSVECGS